MGKNEVKELADRVNRLQEQLSEDITGIKKCIREQQISDSSDRKSEKGAKTSYNEGLIEKLQKLESHFGNEIREIKVCIGKLEERATTIEKWQRKRELSENVNYILIHGIAEGSAGALSECVIGFFKDQMKFEITTSDINKMYRIGRKEDGKTRPIAVEFIHKWKRDKIYYTKKILKGSKIAVTEKLTKENMILYKELKKVVKDSCWSIDGVVYTSSAGRKVRIQTVQDIERLKGKTASNGNTTLSSEEEVRF